jgi:hypothetical protein
MLKKIKEIVINYSILKSSSNLPKWDKHKDYQTGD